MISLEAYSDLPATLHAAPLDDARWEQFLGQLCASTESVYGIFTSNDSALERRILAHSGMPAFAEAHRTYNESSRRRDPFRDKFLRTKTLPAQLPPLLEFQLGFPSFEGCAPNASVVR